MSKPEIDPQVGKQEVATFIAKHVDRSKYSQKEIADMCGFNSPNVITMIKQGLTKLPIEKISKLAKALDLDRIELFTFVMARYRPKELEVIEDIYGESINEAERRVVRLLRETIPEGALSSNPLYYMDKIRTALTD